MAHLNKICSTYKHPLNFLSRYRSLDSLACTVRENHHHASKNEKDIVTHTGQAWDPDDKRMARFLVAPKQVNSNWAVNLIKEAPPMPVKGRIAVCEGGPSVSLGHPKIYINLDEPGPQSCIYCGNRFYKDTSH